jgi:hypothetical protein
VSHTYAQTVIHVVFSTKDQKGPEARRVLSCRSGGTVATFIISKPAGTPTYRVPSALL